MGNFTAVAVSERSTGGLMRDIGDPDDKAKGTPFLPII
jgi:hypothetical protein